MLLFLEMDRVDGYAYRTLAASCMSTLCSHLRISIADLATVLVVEGSDFLVVSPAKE